MMYAQIRHATLKREDNGRMVKLTVKMFIYVFTSKTYASPRDNGGGMVKHTVYMPNDVCTTRGGGDITFSYSNSPVLGFKVQLTYNKLSLAT